MRRMCGILLAGALSLGAADLTVASLYDSQLNIAESEIVPLAKAMPESAYNFAPTKGAFTNVRTFAGQVKHIATVMYMTAAAVKQENPPVDLGKGEDGPDTVKTKAEVVAYLERAFAYAHKAMAGVTAANQLEMVKSPFGSGEMPRGGIAGLTVWHSFDHYGQMAVYARMNNVIPPASQPAQPPPANKK